MNLAHLCIPASLSILFAVACAAPPDDAVETATTEAALASGERGVRECPIAVRCAPGYTAVDTDKDGCEDACVPATCETAIRCAPGYIAIDTDGDGCNDTCLPSKRK